jgi:hypothetical protein
MMTSAVIASQAKQSIEQKNEKLDCFAEPVIGRRFAPTRWLAMTEGYVSLAHIPANPSKWNCRLHERTNPHVVKFLHHFC